MRFIFHPHQAESARPQHHLADFELLLDQEPFAGLRITGAAIWARKAGSPGMSVTFPGVRTLKDGKTQYLSYFRQEAGSSALKDLKFEVLRRFMQEHPELAVPATTGKPGTSSAGKEAGA